MAPPLPATGIRRRTAVVVAVALVAAVGLTGCTSAATAPTSASGSGIIRAVGAERQYADVLGQIGGSYVVVSSILDNPNTDPHTYEASTSVAQEVAGASLVVQNGLGYDTFMNQIEAAAPSAMRRIIVAQHVLGLPDSTPNPHLWYDPRTMPAVAASMAGALEALQPAHRAYFQARLTSFDASLDPLRTAIATFRAHFSGTPVAVTEPVADYLLQAMGADVVTPFSFQADIMNGVDPSPESITREESLFTSHAARVFCYNQQVVSSLTATIRDTARSAGVPIVGVYETMPTPGYDFQTWMEAEVAAIQAAVVHGTSTEHL